ncbi:MAG: O-antigen ligase family protein [Nitrospirae bacterium]|nr:O-antigen ligase family protein [Nitrospirota bacterium]
MISKGIENLYLQAIRIPIFLIPFLPLYVSYSMPFPYMTGKNFAFRILVEIAGALWLGLLVISRESRPRITPMVLLVLIFAFIVGLADLLGVNPYKSFWSTFERMEGYVTILHLSFYFLIIKTVLRKKKDWMLFFNIFVGVSIIVSLYALFITLKTSPEFKLVYMNRVYGTIGNPPFLASYLLLSIFLGLLLMFNARKPLLKYIYILSITLNAIVVYFTATRGAISALIVWITAFCLFYILKQFSLNKLPIKFILTFFGITLVLVSIIWTFRGADIIKDNAIISRFAAISSDTSVSSRLTAWKMAWHGVKERPLLGWGQENFINVYTVSPIPFNNRIEWMNRAHNIILDWLINAGVLGLSAYLSVFFIALYGAWSALCKKIILQTEAFTIVTGLAAYLLQNLFLFDTINTYIIFIAVLAYTDNINHAETSSLSASTADLKKLRLKYLCMALLALIVFSALAYMINYKPIMQSRKYIQANISSTKYDSFFSTLLDIHEQALNFKTFGDTEVRRNMLAVSYQIVKDKLAAQKSAVKFVQATIGEVDKLIESNPGNLEVLISVISLYHQIAPYAPSYLTGAETLIRECINLNPSYEWLYLELANNFILKKDYENAFKTLNIIAGRNPGDASLQLKLASAAIRASKEIEAMSALEKIKQIRSEQDPDIAAGKKPVLVSWELSELSRSYVEIKSFYRAVDLYKQIITASPDSAGYHFDIAVIYLALGDTANALKEAETAAVLDPLNYPKDKSEITAMLKKALTQ